MQVNFKLIERTCLCGCGFVFRVHPNNTINFFANLSHLKKAARHSPHQEIRDIAGDILKKKEVLSRRVSFDQMRQRRKFYLSEIEFIQDGLIW